MQHDNDVGGLEVDDDYDALNDETFGSAINDDWEDVHENLVLLDSNGNTSGRGRDRDKDETDDLGDLGETLQIIIKVTHSATIPMKCPLQCSFFPPILSHQLIFELK